MNNTPTQSSEQNDKRESIDTTIEAITRSREVLEKAEQAVSRSYAVVEISTSFLGRLPKLFKH